MLIFDNSAKIRKSPRIWRWDIIKYQSRNFKKSTYITKTFMKVTFGEAANKFLMCLISKSKKTFQSQLKSLSKTHLRCFEKSGRNSEEWEEEVWVSIKKWCQDCHLLSDKNICVDWGLEWDTSLLSSEEELCSSFFFLGQIKDFSWMAERKQKSSMLTKQASFPCKTTWRCTWMMHLSFIKIN